MISPLCATISFHCNGNTVAIFCFILGLVAIGRYFRYRRMRLWHETVRLAVEKGQPLPSGFTDGSWLGLAWQGPWPLYRGLILVALGIGMELVRPDSVSGAHWASTWAPIPLCIGAALMLVGLINVARGKAGSPPSPSPRQ